MKQFGMETVVAINLFPGDTEEEISIVKNFCKVYNVNAVECRGFSEGGKGMTALAAAVVDIVSKNKSRFTPLYDTALTTEEKIHIIATQIYGAAEVAYSVKAKSQLKQIKDLGFDAMPVCMAKTPKSLSDDENKKGRPEKFTITIREFEYAAGAGFIIPILGEIMRMPGLPNIPAAEGMDIDAQGKITGLS